MKRKKMMTWTWTWLNASATALNATFQLLVIYRLVFNPRDVRDHLKSHKYKKIQVIALNICYTLLRLLVITTLFLMVFTKDPEKLN